MATTIFLESYGTPAIKPTPDAGWTDITQFKRYIASPTKKAGSVMTTANISDAVSDQQDILIGQWITEPLVVGQTITGGQTISIQLRCAEVAAANNLNMNWGMYIFNGVTLKKTVLAKRTDDTEVTLTTLTNRTDSTTSAVTNYITVFNDRLVIEIGLEGNPTSTAVHTGSISFGSDSATNLPADDTTTTADNPTVILNDTLTFMTNSNMLDFMMHR